MLTAMDRAAASCTAWIPGGSSNTTTSVICPRSVPMPESGISAGLDCFCRLVQKQSPRFPGTHRIISNIKAYVEEAFHSLPKAHIQVVCRLVQLKIQPQGFF
jgi:hypothetical protein